MTVNIEDEGPDFNSISSLEEELRRLIRWSNQYGSKGADSKIEQLKTRIEQLKTRVNESKEKDIVDTITMDVPLFIRMLEYAKEDAKDDMVLHNITEKANKLGKEQGILTMDDYNNIIETDTKEQSRSMKVENIINILRKKML